MSVVLSADEQPGLKRSEQFLRLALDGARMGTWDWDIVRSTLEWDTNQHAIFGDPERRVPPSVAHWERAVHPDDLSRVKAQVQRAVDDRRTYHCEYRIIWPDGSLHWIESRGHAVYDAEGRAIRMLGTVMEVTQRVQAEEHRRQMEQRLQETQKLKSLGVLAGGIAHDFNNLLTPILGHAAQAASLLPAESPAAPLLHEIERSAQLATDLIRQLLAYVGKGQFVTQPLDLARLVREMAPLLETMVSRQARLHFELAADSPPIEADAAQVRQVILNLASNASDALAGQRGEIHLRTGRMHLDAAGTPATYGSDELLAAGTYGFVEVTDSGCGMRPDMLPQIFEPFYTTKFTGRGLGLSAVQGIARKHRGGIRATSEPGRGSTFRVLFPVSTGLPPAAEVRKLRAEWRGRGIVLVIEDNAAIRQMVRRSLEASGFEVRESRDGLEGVEAFRNSADELVLVVLDLTMPRQGGLETLAELRALRQDVPVILMSGYTESELSSAFSPDARTGFLQKPFKSADLLQAARSVLEDSI